jgi:hypothetical protein
MHQLISRKWALFIVPIMAVVLVCQASAAPSPAQVSSQTWGWRLIGPPGGEVFDFDVDPHNSLRLYATTRAGVYHSTDGGLTWGLCRVGYSRDLVIDPQNGNVIYVCPGVCKSSSGGEDWACYDKGMTDTNVASLAIAAGNPNVLFAGSF